MTTRQHLRCCTASLAQGLGLSPSSGAVVFFTTTLHNLLQSSRDEMMALPGSCLRFFFVRLGSVAVSGLAACLGLGDLSRGLELSCSGWLLPGVLVSARSRYAVGFGVSRCSGQDE